MSPLLLPFSVQSSCNSFQRCVPYMLATDLAYVLHPGGGYPPSNILSPRWSHNLHCWKVFLLLYLAAEALASKWHGILGFICGACVPWPWAYCDFGGCKIGLDDRHIRPTHSELELPSFLLVNSLLSKHCLFDFVISTLMCSSNETFLERQCHDLWHTALKLHPSWYMILSPQNMLQYPKIVMPPQDT